MNSTMGPSFKVKFVFFRTYRSYKQYMRQNKKHIHTKNTQTCYPNTHIVQGLAC